MKHPLYYLLERKQIARIIFIDFYIHRRFYGLRLVQWLKD